MCAAMASTGTRLRCASNSPLIRCRLPGPQLPAQTAELSGERGIGRRSEGGRLLVTDVLPTDFTGRAAAHR